MQYLKQSTAKTLRYGPFLDEDDGKTAETALTILQADVRLSKDGGAFAQKNDATAATHDENGWYSIPLNATDTNTIGTLIVAIHESGALPVWREFMVVPANVYDSLIAGTDTLQADVTQIGGDAQSATDLKDFADAGYDPATNKVQGVVLTDTATNVTNQVTADVTAVSGDSVAADNLEADYDGTGYNKANSTIGTASTLTGHTPQTGDNFARLGAPAGASVSADIAAVKSDTGAILTDTADMQPKFGTIEDLGSGANIGKNFRDLAGATFVTGTDSNEAIADAVSAISVSGLSELSSGTAQAGAAGSITLAAGESAVDDFYNGTRILITGNTGAGQSRIITDYNGTTKVASISPNWITNPDLTSTYEIQAAEADLESIGKDSIVGNAATLTLKQFDITNNAGPAMIVKSTGSNGIGLDIAGHGSGHGLVAASNSGNGIYASSNSGIGFSTGSASSWATQFSSGAGAFNIAAGNGVAINASSGATNAVVFSAGGGSGIGFSISGSGTGTDISASEIGTPSDLGGGASLADNLADMAGATFATGTDSLEAIRNRGDAAWVTASGTLDANLVSIDGQATNGNNATLYLKALDIQNSVGDAVTMKSTGGNGKGIVYAGHGSGHAIEATGGTTSGSALKLIATASDTISASAGASTSVIYLSGPSHGLNIFCGGDAIRTSSTGGYGMNLGGSSGGINAAEIGTPSDLGEGASLAKMLFAMANKTNGVNNFDQTTDSNEAVADAVGTISVSGLSELASGTAQAGSTASTIKLASGESAVADYYNGTRILTTGGTGSGQSRMITDYDETTKIATISPNWKTTPDATTTYEIQAAEADLETIGQNSIVGNVATLTLKQFDIQNSAGTAVIIKSTGSNGRGLDIAGHGSGSALYLEGGTTGVGFEIKGGGTSGNAISVSATDGKGLDISSGGANDGITVTGSGAGSGLSVAAGTTGKGIAVAGGATSGDGIEVTTTSGKGIDIETTSGKAFSLISGDDNAIFLDGGGSVSAMRISASGGGAGDGIEITATGTGSGVNISGGSGGGHGFFTKGGTGGGSGLKIVSVDDDALDITSGGTGNDGLKITSTDGAALSLIGTGSNPGLYVEGGSTGVGLVVKGGATSGDAVQFTAQGGDSDGIQITGFGAGDGMNVVAGATGDISTLFNEVMDEPSAGVPSATPTVATILGYHWAAIRNKGTSTSTVKKFYNNAGTALVKKVVSDDGTTYTEAKMTAA
jgi:hypothetical protein